MITLTKQLRIRTTPWQIYRQIAF